MPKEIWQIALIIGAAVILLFPLIKFLLKPLKLAVKLLINGIAGFILLWLINTFGGQLGLFFPINLITVIVVGFLGIPGIFLLWFINYLITA